MFRNSRPVFLGILGIILKLRFKNNPQPLMIMSSNISLERIEDSSLIEAVKKSLHQGPYCSIVKELCEGVLKNHPVFLIGGAVRNPLIKAIHSENREPSDYDLLVDDSTKPIDFRKFLDDNFDLVYNRFGNIKLRNETGLSVDIVSFSRKKLYIDGNHGENPTLDAILQSGDFVMSSLAFDLDNEVIHSYGALQDIKNRKINILRVTETESTVMSRAVLYERKLAFNICEETKSFIAQKYSPKMNDEIRKYLEYKNKSKDYNYAIGRLRQISEEEKRTRTA
jgi:tRNA nucleotidyltransferase/poly(A) polymerase